MLQARLDRYFTRLARKSRRPEHFQVLVHADKLNLHYTYSTNRIDQRFHSASVGKLFTATLLAMLEEQGRISFHDPISRYFSPGQLDGLFRYKGADYQEQVTIEHLIGHTSGVNDYFDGKVLHGPRFIRMLLNEPERFWSPDSLITFTRDRQSAVGAPGQTFLYSDTGYLLLGQLIEQATGMSFHDNLHRHIFQPLGMSDSYLMFYSQPENNSPQPIEQIWVKGREISAFTSLSCDWSGGGVISTVHDLYTFLRALQEGRLYSKKRLEQMETARNKFRAGIHYGLGMMEIRFEEFFFLLRGLPRLKGHSGILATHLYYDPVHDAYLVMNMASTAKMSQSFRAIIEIVTALQAADREMSQP